MNKTNDSQAQVAEALDHLAVALDRLACAVEELRPLRLAPAWLELTTKGEKDDQR